MQHAKLPCPSLSPSLLKLMCIDFSHSSVSRESACKAGDLGLIPGSGRSSGEGNGNPLQYSCLENPMDGGIWQATVHGIARVGHNLVTKPPLPCVLNQWCCPTISSSITLFSCLQSFPASGSFPMSWLFASGGQIIGAAASVFSMNIQSWFPLGLIGLISLLSKGLSRVFSNTRVWKHKFFSSQPALGPNLTPTHDY